MKNKFPNPKHDLKILIRFAELSITTYPLRDTDRILIEAIKNQLEAARALPDSQLSFETEQAILELKRGLVLILKKKNHHAESKIFKKLISDYADQDN